jgi:hypothetical protein
MILDERNEFADARSVAGSAGTALIGDVIDRRTIAPHLPTDIDADESAPLYLVIQTDTEITTGGSAGTIRFQLASDAQADIATDGSATIHFDTGPLVTDDAAANSPQLNAGGLIACFRLPPFGRDWERYLGLLRVIGTTTVTAGKINAFLTKNPSNPRAYPRGAV